jgi:hypothetical protein
MFAAERVSPSSLDQALSLRAVSELDCLHQSVQRSHLVGCAPYRHARECQGASEGYCEIHLVLEGVLLLCLLPALIPTQALRFINNFSGMMAIVAGLNNSAVLRLKKTMREVPQKYTDVCTPCRSYVSGFESS